MPDYSTVLSWVRVDRGRYLERFLFCPFADGNVAGVPRHFCGRRNVAGGLFAMEVPVNVNRRLFDYDQLIIVGPVFPHEVVGSSGVEGIH